MVRWRQRQQNNAVHCRSRRVVCRVDLDQNTTTDTAYAVPSATALGTRGDDAGASGAAAIDYGFEDDEDDYE